MPDDTHSTLDKILADLDRLVRAKSEEAVHRLHKDIEHAIKKAAEEFKTKHPPVKEQARKGG